MVALIYSTEDIVKVREETEDFIEFHFFEEEEKLLKDFQINFELLRTLIVDF